MDSDLRQRLLELDLDIVALEVDLHLQIVRSLPLPPTSSPAIAWANLWLYHMLPAVLQEVPIPISMASYPSPGSARPALSWSSSTPLAERSFASASRQILGMTGG